MAERVFARWADNSNGDHPDDRTVRFSIEGRDAKNTYFSADFDHLPQGLVVFGLGLRVDPEYRRRGYAKRLLGAMTALAVKEGARQVEIPIESPYVMHSFADLFNEKYLTFYDIAPHDGQMTTLPLSPSQAVASLSRATRFERDPENREHGVVVFADMKGIKKNRLQLPVEEG